MPERQLRVPPRARDHHRPVELGRESHEKRIGPYEPRLVVRAPRRLVQVRRAVGIEPLAWEPVVRDVGIHAQRRQRFDQRRAGDLVVVERERPVAAALVEEPGEGTVDGLRERVQDDPVGDRRKIAADGRVGAVVECDQDLVGDGAQGAEQSRDARSGTGRHHEDRKGRARTARASFRLPVMRHSRRAARQVDLAGIVPRRNAFVALFVNSRCVT